MIYIILLLFASLSFSEDFKIHENDRIAYKQFGNAVNVEVIYKVMYETFRAYSMV